MTTNGATLGPSSPATWHAAGLAACQRLAATRCDPTGLPHITNRDALARVIDGIDAAVGRRSRTGQGQLRARAGGQRRRDPRLCRLRSGAKALRSVSSSGCRSTGAATWTGDRVVPGRRGPVETIGARLAGRARRRPVGTVSEGHGAGGAVPLRRRCRPGRCDRQRDPLLLRDLRPDPDSRPRASCATVSSRCARPTCGRCCELGRDRRRPGRRHRPPRWAASGPGHSDRPGALHPSRLAR